MKEIIAVKEITRFKTRTEEFSPYAWCKRMLENDPVSYHEGRIRGMSLNMKM